MIHGSPLNLMVISGVVEIMIHVMLKYFYEGSIFVIILEAKLKQRAVAARSMPYLECLQ
jgi:hypothetical protein